MPPKRARKKKKDDNALRDYAISAAIIGGVFLYFRWKKSPPDDACKNKACVHGVCRKGFCECDTGWEGVLCDRKLDPGCVGVSCGSHGKAEKIGSEPCKCVCTDGFKGNDCSVPPDVPIPPPARWTKLPGTAVEASIGRRDFMAYIDIQGRTFYSMDLGQNWQQLPGTSKYISAGADYTLMSISSDNQLNWYNDETKNWVPMSKPGTPAVISCGTSERMAYMDTAGEIYVWDQPGNTWVRMPAWGGADYRPKTVIMSADGQFWYLDDHGRAFLRGVTAFEMQTTHAGTSFAVGDRNHVFTVAAGGHQLYQWTGAILGEKDMVHVPTPAIEVRDVAACAEGALITDTNGSMYFGAYV